jgi:hypothetical protein
MSMSMWMGLCSSVVLLGIFQQWRDTEALSTTSERMAKARPASSMVEGQRKKG